MYCQGSQTYTNVIFTSPLSHADSTADPVQENILTEIPSHIEPDLNFES